MTSTQPRTKRIQVKAACSNCRKKHQGCDNQRPCKRCINTGNEDTCVDIPHRRYKTKPSDKTPAPSRGPKAIISFADLMTNVEDIVVGKLEEENGDFMMTLNTENLISNNPREKPSPSKRKSTSSFQSKLHRSELQRQVKRRSNSSPLPPNREPMIMTWTIPDIINAVGQPTSAPPTFLPPSLTYGEHMRYSPPQENIIQEISRIPDTSTHLEGLDLMGNGLNHNLDYSNEDNEDLRNSLLNLEGWDSLGWYDDLTMSEELFEN